MSKIIGSHIPAKLQNLAINGAFDFFQERVGNSLTINASGGVAAFIADMMKAESGGTTVHNYSFARSTDVPSQAQSGFQSSYSALFTHITAIASPAATDFEIPFEYYMEGLDYAKIHSKTMTVGFWIKASVVGTYSFAVTRAAFDRSYNTTFTMNGANTWEFKSITIPLDTASGYLFDNSASLRFFIGAVAGANFSTATTNTWQGLGALATTGATNWQATAGATLRIAQFSIVEGPLGFSSTGFARAGDDIQVELAMCQRYYEKSFPVDFIPQLGGNSTSFATDQGLFIGTSSNTIEGASVSFKISKRSSPTVVQYGNNIGQYRSLNPGTAAVQWSTASAVQGVIGTNGFILSQQLVASTLLSIATHWVADARM